MPPRRGHEDNNSSRTHIPRPPNAFILFRSSFIRSNHVPGQVEGNHSTLSKIIGLCWKALPAQERRSWEEKARLAQAEHRTLYPDWRWTPEANALGKKRARKRKKSSGDESSEESSRRKGKGKGRESSSEHDEDLRVAKIADLVKEGKTGVDLEKALEEWQANLSPRPPKKRRISRKQPQLTPSPSDHPQETLHHLPSHTPSHTPSPTPLYPHQRPVQPPPISWSQNTTPASYPPSHPNYSQWWNPPPQYGPCYQPPQISTDGLGYQQGSRFNREYEEQFGPIPHNDHPQWSRNPGRNGICTVIPDPLPECDQSPTTPSSASFPPPVDVLPTNIISPSPSTPFFAPNGNIPPESPNPAFIPSTYSSLTGWAGEFGDPAASASSSGWFSPGWQGPQRLSSSWGQQSDISDSLPRPNTQSSHHNHKIPYPDHSSLPFHPPAPSPTSVLHQVDSNTPPQPPSS